MARTASALAAAALAASSWQQQVGSAGSRGGGAAGAAWVALLMATAEFAAATVPDATSCSGWSCSTEGQYCPPGATGSGGSGYCCVSDTWVAGRCTIAESCTGWSCSAWLTGQYCPPNRPGSSGEGFCCSSSNWVTDLSACVDCPVGHLFDPAMATDLQPMDDINLSVCAPTPRPTLAGALAVESSTEASSGGGGGGDANVAGLDVGVFVTILVLALLLLCAVAGTVTYRRERRRRLREEQAYDLETGGGDAAYKAALARQRDVNECVATGMSLVNALLTVGSAVPFVGELAESANQLFGSAREFGDKADDVAMAARRVNEVLGMVHLVAKNVENLEDGKDLVAAKMERLVSLLTQFNAAMRRFGEKGWLKRMWTVRTHVDSLGELDKEIMAALDAFRDVYRFATDSVVVQRTYRLEASISQLVAERVHATGESEEAARTALAEDPVVIQAVAIGAGVPPAELASELSEFRLEVRECFGRVEGSLDSMLARIRASAITPRFRDKVVTRSFLREQLSAGKDRAKNDDKRLAELEVALDSCEATPFAQGGEGAVFVATSEGEPVCLKKIHLVDIIQAERQRILASFKREVTIACEVRSQRCVRLLGVVTTDPTYLGLVTEYLEGGSLRAALSAEGAISADRRRTWASDVAQGMKYLYAHGIEHRDLKSGNVLLTAHQDRAKVADFGLSRREELSAITRTKAGPVGTAAYMAPELLEDNVFSEASDVYSYGILLWEIWDRGVPWRGLQPMKIMRKVVDKRERPPVPAGMPDDVRALVGKCWAPAPDDRPDFAAITQRLHAPRSPPPVPPATTGQGTTKPLA